MDRLVIGIIRGTRGLSGHVRVESLSDETAHFERLRGVTIALGSEERRYDVESVEVTTNGVVLKLRGVDTKDEAATLIGAEIEVERRRAARRRRGEYYARDLIGSTVVRRSSIVGRVAGVVTTGASDLIEIELSSGEVILVPFVKEYIGRIRPRRRRLELKSSWELE